MSAALAAIMLSPIQSFASSTEKLEAQLNEKKQVERSLSSIKKASSDRKEKSNKIIEDLAGYDQSVLEQQKRLNEAQALINDLEDQMYMISEQIDLCKQKKEAKEDTTPSAFKTLDQLRSTQSVKSSATEDMLKDQLTLSKNIEATLLLQQAELEKEREAALSSIDGLDDTIRTKEEEKANLELEDKKAEEEAKALEKKLDELKPSIEKLTVEAEKERKAKEEEARRKGIGSGTFMWPSASSHRISSPFGYRIHPTLGYRKLHTGMDIAAPYGTNVLAADSGVVISAGPSGSYGNLVLIDHQNGFVTAYAHNSSIVVSVGEHVAKGQVISKVGSTGRSTGPHIHFEVRKNGTFQNPIDYLQ